MVCQYENQITKPDMNMLRKIGSFFGVSVDYLTGKTDNPNDASWRQQSPTSPRVAPTGRDFTLLTRNPSAPPLDISGIHIDYLEIAKEMQDNKIATDDVRMIMNILLKNRT
jgi:hypothetical protein